MTIIFEKVNSLCKNLRMSLLKHTGTILQVAKQKHTLQKSTRVRVISDTGAIFFGCEAKFFHYILLLCPVVIPFQEAISTDMILSRKT